MANADHISDNPSTSSRKRPHFHDLENPEQDGPADMNLPKKSRTSSSNGAWANLDLVLTLQRKDTPLERKIKIAFHYVKSIGDGDDRGREVVPLPRLVSFLMDWIQPTLIASENGKRDSELCDPCLDYRCWAVLQFCLHKSSASVSPNLLRAITRVLQHALLQFADDSLLHGEELSLLFNHVFECLSVLLSHCRAFHSSGVELWVSCAVEVVNLVCKVLTSDELRISNAEVLLSLSTLLLEHFSIFLRFHPNPRNVFRAFIDRLLEPLLELMVLLQLRVNGANCKIGDSLLRMVNEILSNGVFHPAHISGFLSLRSSNADEAGRQQKSINESYHRHLFHRLEKMIADKKAVPLGGFGYLLCLFISKAKSYNVANLSSMVNDASGKHSQIKQEDEKTSKALFGIFTQFLEPLLLECKRCTELDLSQDEVILELKLVEGHCMLKSVNETLASFVTEKIYVPTEDNSEESHFNFLKKVYDIIFSVSAKIYLFWLSMLHKENVGIKRILPLVAKEIFVAVGYLFDAECKAVGNNLIELWLMILSYLTIQMHLGHTKTCSLLVSEILKLSSQLINIYSELRQISPFGFRLEISPSSSEWHVLLLTPHLVHCTFLSANVHTPIFALCKAVRLFTVASDADSVGSSSFVASSPLCSEICLKSMTTLLNSETCRLAISDSIKLIPERQANGCVQQLIIDIGDAFDWIKYGHLSDCIYLSETSTLTGRVLVLGVQAELLGRFLSEIYTIILDSLTITATNSVLVGNAVENLMKSLSPSFSHIVQSSSMDVNDFIYSITGQKLSIEEFPEHQNGSQTISNILSWFLVFYFRMHTYCRNLYRQSISLLPPNSAKKASDVMGNLFCVSSGLGWRNNLKFLDSGYFSWITKPSVSLLDVIHSLSEGFLSSSFLAYAPLVYALHVMAIQRINDLNRMLKAYEFLQDKSPKVSQAPLGNHDKLKLSKQLSRLISTSRSEAKRLTKFLCGYLPVLASDGKCICNKSLKSCKVTKLVSDGGNLDAGVSLPDDNSLPGPLWLLLCRNIDVWFPHASNKALKTFFSYLLLYSLPCGSALEEPLRGEPLISKINMHKVALELINDCILYEQPDLSKHVTSRFCRALRKSFTSLMNHSNASCKDFYSLLEGSEILNRSFQDPLAYQGGTDTSPAYSSLAVSNFVLSEISGWQSCPFQTQLKVCEALLHLLCNMPGVHVTASSFAVYVTCILNLERLVISNLRKSHCDSLVSNSCELFKLFVACRRAMKHIATSVENEQIVQTSCLSTIFNRSTILWLLKSADELVGLSYATFGEKYYNQIETMKFSLVDHTSYIFMTVSRAVMNLPLALHAILFDGKLHKKLPLDSGTCKENASNLASQHSETSENIGTWELLEIFSEILAHQARDATVMLKDMIHAVEQETDHSILNWNRLSCLVSCLQGYLWGLASILDGTNDHLIETQEFPICSLSRLSTLRNFIILFENFVYYCISILIFSDQQGIEIQQMRNHLDKNILANVDACTSECSFGEDGFSFGKYSMLHNQGKSHCNYCDDDIKCPDDGHIMNNTIRIGKSLTNLRKHVRNAFRGIYDINLSNLQHLRVSFFHSLLEGRSRHLAFMVRQLFLASAAIIKLRCTLLFPIGLKSHISCRQLSPNLMTDLLVTSHIILQGVAEMVGRPDPFTFVWVDGILNYLEVFGSYINLTDPNLSKEVYGHLVDIHLRAIGKCISLQGKSATLLSHETGSNTKMLQRETPSTVQLKQSIYARDNVINEFKGRLRSSFIKLIGRPTKIHLKLASQSIERALTGLHQGRHMVCEVTTGNSNGGRVSPVVAGGIDCLDLLLEFASGQKQVIKESISSLVVCLFNIVVHLQHPKIFYTDMKPHNKTYVDPDAGSVILMCVEVLITISGKNSLQMDRAYTSQCLHIPMVLFKDFHQLRDSLHRPQSTYNPDKGSFENVHDYIVDRQFSVDLYSSCCKLLYTTLKHHIREVEQCVAILQASVVTLLNCLEMVGANSLGRKGYFAWNMQEAIKSASFLRRIYEEIRQQKDALGRFVIFFLSSYISLYSGFGPLQAGIKREIDEALRPGIYSLIDICTSNDIQQLHTVLEESSCRSTLSTLMHDYKLNFQFEGKV